MSRTPTSDDFGDLIAASWTRCQAMGLSHATPAGTHRIATPEPAQRFALLLETTEREVLPYYENILANSRSLILLADHEGRLLKHWGDRRFIEPGREALFETGTSWQERDNGTNAIGTAIASGQAVQVQRNEHFLTANRFMTGCAAPILDAEQNLVGVLNVSSDAYLPQAHTLGMVKLMATAVENRLLVHQYGGGCALLTFNTNADNLDSQWSGLLAIDADGEVMAANRRAAQLLGTDLLHQPITGLVDMSLSSLLNQSDDHTFPLQARTRRHLYASLRKPDRRSGEAPAAKQHARHPQSAAGFRNVEFGDAQIQRCIRQATRVAGRDIPILIQGETGVGKEVFVKALHQASARREKPLVAVNCAAIPSELVESELFGYAKGAFTGASLQGSTGLIRKADGGILFLDEIGEMPARAQARLLRVLQEREVLPVGATEAYPVNIHLVSATNQPLKERIESGVFRRDLYYRISGLALELPPLRQRTDRRSLIRHIHTLYRDSDQPSALPDAILDLLEQHPWPGNVRQLINVMQVALAMAGPEPVETWHLPDDFLQDLQLATVTPIEPALAVSRPAGSGPGSTLDALLEVYNRHQGNVSRTARHLGFSRNTVYKRLRELGVR